MTPGPRESRFDMILEQMNIFPFSSWMEMVNDWGVRPGRILTVVLSSPAIFLLNWELSVYFRGRMATSLLKLDRLVEWID